MTKEGKATAEKALARAYAYACGQLSDRRHRRSAATRDQLRLEAFEASLLDDRYNICKLLLLVAERLEDNRPFDIVDDLDLLDAMKDLVEYGCPQDWKINRDGELEFA